MKPKLKFDSTKIKGFFVEHGEKLGLGLGAILFVWLCYAAVQTKGYDKQPDQLAKDSTNVANEIHDNKFNADHEGVKLPDPPYAEQWEKVSTPIQGIAMGIVWSPPVRDTRVRRDEPRYLPPHDLKV